MKKLLSIILLLGAFVAQAQIGITGRVSDDNGDTLPGVNVVLKGTSTGAVTDIDGKYSLTVPDEKAVLVFIYVGYQEEELVVGKRRVIDITLKTDNKALEEVVVAGMGRSRKGLFSGKKKRGYAPTSGSSIAPPPSQESYDAIKENGFLGLSKHPLSTFSIDVDAASYSNMRRYINNGAMPPKDAVRIEEMINYFDYEYQQPTDKHPFAIQTETATCPWNEEHRLVHIGIQGKDISTENLPPSNLVFLIDVSGSMGDPDKLPLLKSAFRLLVNKMRPEDRVAIVVYASATGLVLPSTSGKNKDKIIAALDGLDAGGSTAGGAGLQLAYKVAQENFKKNGNNRIILATDGDFNVGLSSDEEMVALIEEKRESGVFLSCLGFGSGNLKDSKMEKLADKGNGNYAYIDNLLEANKVLVTEFGGTLFTIAKDVKIQLEFNPSKVQAYRLIGYENRLLNDEDFADDKKDAGELGAGHTVTALYEVIPVGVKNEFTKKIPNLKYSSRKANSNYDEELFTVKFRYKKPDGNKSILISHPVKDKQSNWEASSNNFRFSASVAAFGMLLRDSEFKESLTYEQIIDWAKVSKGTDEEGYRAEFINIVKSVEALAN